MILVDPRVRMIVEDVRPMQNAKFQDLTPKMTPKDRREYAYSDSRRLS